MGVRRMLGTTVLASVLTVSGCAAVAGGPDAETDVDVAGTWLLVSGRTVEGPLAVTPDTHTSLTFDEDGLGGQGPCNDYGSDYALDGDAFVLTGDGMSSTLMGCEVEVLALESAYLSALGEVDTVARDGGTLAMTGDGAELVFSLQEPWPRADVVRERWRLVSWTDESGDRHRPEWKRGLRPFIRFGDSGGVGGRISASSGCRVLEGRWRTWRGAPSVTRATWRGRCPDRLMPQEMVVSSALGEPVIDVRRRAGHAELVVRYAHANSPAAAVYRVPSS